MFVTQTTVRKSSQVGLAKALVSVFFLWKGRPSAMRLIPLVMLALVLWVRCPALCADASMFRGNPEHTGAYASAGISAFHKVKWKFHTHGSIVSSPAVANGTLYVGSHDGYLYALNSDSGALKWKFKTASRVDSSPAVDNGLVYFGSYDGYFYAVNANNGRLKWKFKTAGERRFAGTHLHGSQPLAETMPDPFDTYLSSPVIWQSAVYFGSGDGNIYSLNARSGAPNWTFKTGDVVHASPAIAAGKLFVGSWDSYFYALDATNGKMQWRFKTGEDPDVHNQVGIQSSAAIADGMVYFGCRDSHLYALDADSGRKKWSIPTDGSWVISSPAVLAGKVYFATSDSGLFYEVDGKTGKTGFELKLRGWPTFSSPAVSSSMIFVGSHAGKLLAIDPKAGRISWTFETDGAKQYGRHYTKLDGTPNYEAAFASDFYDDMIVGAAKMMSVGAILSSPVVVDNVVYVGSSDGNIYALT